MKDLIMQRRFLIAVLAWAVALLGWLGLLAVERAVMGSTFCELAPGSSIYGEASWSWIPPGVHCEWDKALSGATVLIEQPPPAARVGTASVFVLWGITLLLLRPPKDP